MHKIHISELLEDPIDEYVPEIEVEACLDMAIATLNLCDADVNNHTYAVAIESAITAESTDTANARKNVIQKIVDWVASVFRWIGEKFRALLEKIKSIFNGKPAKVKVSELRSSGARTVSENQQRKIELFNEIIAHRLEFNKALEVYLTSQKTENDERTFLKARNEYLISVNNVHKQVSALEAAAVNTVPINYATFNTAAEYIDYGKKQIENMKTMVAYHKKHISECQRAYYNTADIDRQLSIMSDIHQSKLAVRHLTENININMQNLTNVVVHLNNACRSAS